MADIRRTGLLDDFNRPDETPTILPPWFMLQSSLDQGGNVELMSHVLRGTTFPTASSTAYWGRQAFGSASGDIELWGLHGGSAALADYSRIGMCTYATNDSSQPDGYQVLFGQSIGGNVWLIRRFTGGTVTDVGTSYTGAIPGTAIVMVRKTGGYIDVHMDADGTGAGPWTLTADYTDPSPFNGPWMFHLGTTGVETGWGPFGGGAITRSQIYRYVSN